MKFMLLRYKLILSKVLCIRFFLKKFFIIIKILNKDILYFDLKGIKSNYNYFSLLSNLIKI